MKTQFIHFKSTFKDFIAFSIMDIEKAFPGFDTKNLTHWQRKGYLLKIRNGWYTFSDNDLQQADMAYVANKIYGPSYVSLESALSHYGFIPEGTFMTTSVSTRRSQLFSTPVGQFRFQTIKPALCFGYHLKKNRHTWYKIAQPEKVLIDYLYLHPELNSEDDYEALRWNAWQISETLNEERLQHYLGYINSKALNDRFRILNQYLHAFIG
jgi:predicted transcriptional regulator of viral defense system